MKHRVKMMVEREVPGLFGRTKKVRRLETVYVDGRTYRAMQRAREDAELDEFMEIVELDDILEDD